MDQTIARTPAMVYGVDQRLCRLYDAGQALRHGTLFPELYKPVEETVLPIDEPPATARQALGFAAWELRLYLDTHPSDLSALDLYRRNCEAMDAPPPSAHDRWDWTDGPWPWELDG